VTDQSPSSDRNPFDQAAEAFRRFRPRYPQVVFDKIMENFPPPRERALDLGAGTGLSTLPLCTHFEEVIAVEPSEPMAETLADLSPRIRVISRTAEQLPDSPDVTVDLVTVASALYWMNGEVALEKIARWLRPDGRLAVFRHGIPVLTGFLKRIIDREYSENWDDHRHPRLRDEGYSLRTVRSSPFYEDVEVFSVPNRIFVSAHQLVGFYSSTSYGAAYLRSIEEPQFYLEELEREIQESVDGEPFAIDFNIELILGIRKRDGSA
jgi:SAM-dependent methyltransferase